MLWADKVRHLRVRVNADTPADAHRAATSAPRASGSADRAHVLRGRPADRDAGDDPGPETEGRKKALAKLLPMQRGDFEAIFRAMEGYPVCIRLLDPPLHEFLPKEKHEIEGLARRLGASRKTSQRSVLALQETNPMLGLRGCRLGIIYPEISTMQAAAIFEAACAVASRKGRVMPEVMIPLTANVVEFRKQALIVREVAEQVFREKQLTVPYLLGTMIELPRAALTADEIAREAQFFSFGTNDLTQTTWGSRATTPAASCPTTWSTTSSRMIRSRCWTSVESAS
jgi:pyruvate,orthophosphate dikinase